MNELLEWAGVLALCMLAAAVLVAGWEHLAREAAAADRDASRNAQPPPNPALHPGLHPGSHHLAAVDLPLDAEPGAPTEGNASHAAMAAVLTRAAQRPSRDTSPWLDTCPQVTVGCAASETASPAVTAIELLIPTPTSEETVASAQPSTIERAALR